MSIPTNQNSRKVNCRWLSVEGQIDQIVKRFGGVAAYPELIALFVQRGVGLSKAEGVHFIVEVMQSSNMDICIEAINFILELTEIDADLEDRTLTIASSMADQFVESSLPQSLTGVLHRINPDREEEKDAIFKVLGIFENLFELKPEAVEIAGQKSGLIQWILSLLITESGVADLLKKFDDNKLYASEILAILMQNSSNQRYFANLNCMEKLVHYLRTLQELNQFPMDFKETILNVFNCVALCQMDAHCQQEFAQCEGIDVMLRLLKYVYLIKE